MKSVRGTYGGRRVHAKLALGRDADAGEAPGGVEIVCPSVSSDGFYEMFGGIPDPTKGAPRARTFTSAMQAANPHVKYVDGIGHGWVCVDVTPDQVQADWHLTPVPTTDVPDPRVVRDIEPRFAAAFVTRGGSRSLTRTHTLVGARSDSPRTAALG